VARTARYSADEVSQLAYEGQAPDTGALATAWRRMLGEAREIIASLPPAEVGTCVQDPDGSCSGHAVPS
jgi:hypothetical protein